MPGLRRPTTNNLAAITALVRTCRACGAETADDGSCPPCRVEEIEATFQQRSARAKPVYTHRSVAAMLDALLADGGVMRGVEEEIAALATQAERLIGAAADPLAGIEDGIVMAPKDVAAELRKTLDSIVSAKNRRQEMLEREGYYVSYTVFQGFLAEVGRVLRKHVRDERLLRAVGEDLMDLQIRYRDTARAAA